MTEWRECKLGDVAIFTNGKSRPGTKGYIPVYGGNGILEYTDQSNYDGETIIIGRVGAYCGSVYYENRPIWVSDNALAAKPKVGCSAKYLYHLLKLSDLNQYAEGSSHPLITQTLLNSIDITYCDSVDEQKAIAEVLSSLDDKIDLLTRQNKTLEVLAQAYFRKWFIEDASEEWEIKKLRDFGEIVCGKTPPTTNKKFFNGNIPFIKIPDMHNNVYIFDTADTLSEMGAKYQENKFIPPLSICVSCIATVGLVSMNAFLSQTNQQINSLIPKHDKYRYYLFLFMRSYRDELLALGSGGTMTLNINKTLFGDIECYCPDDEILFRFNNVVNPLFGKIYNNCKQIHILSKLRDTLLPKLISGEIRVKM
jgi:type I restriction enzyme S subunit